LRSLFLQEKEERPKISSEKNVDRKKKKSMFVFHGRENEKSNANSAQVRNNDREGLKDTEGLGRELARQKADRPS